jgi:cytidine deaminase
MMAASACEQADSTSGPSRDQSTVLEDGGEYLRVPPEDTDVRLIAQARDALEHAHAPYSEYSVGAALETADGTVYTGCNIENANYSNSLHAEEVALGTAVSDGHREFARLAVTSSARDGVTPCGMCRQTLAEFCPGEFEIRCDAGDTVETYRLDELLPDTITATHLENAE